MGHGLRHIFLLACFLGLGSERLLAQEVQTTRIRSLRAGFGSPAPSWIGGSLSLEILPQFELFLSAGWSRWDELKVWSLNPHIRTRMIPNSVVSPVIGGGVNILLVSGPGAFQGVEHSIPLAQMLLGLDFQLGDNWVITAGSHFHFPIKLIFPLLEVGMTFQ